MIFGFGLIVFLGTCFFTLFTLRLCRRRPQDEPFRFSSHFEKYFSLEGDENSLPIRLARMGFSVASLRSQGGSILANLKQEFEAREYGEHEVTRQARMIGVEARFCGGVWIGRIYARPVVCWAFYDGANLARVAVENTGAHLELSLQTDPPAQLK